MSRILDADIHTSFFEASLTHREVPADRVRPSPLNRVAWLRRNHRWAFPILVPLFAAVRPRAETTVLSTIGWSQFARPRGSVVAYWHAPARWLYQTDVYIGTNAKGRAVRMLRPLLRRLDVRAAKAIDLHLANSNEIADRVRSIYGVDVSVIPPPITFDGTPEPVDGIEPGYLMVVSRFIRYKNIDMVIEAMRSRPDLRLVVVGSGPDGERLTSMASDNIRFVGATSDDELAWLYANSAGVITVAHEDFGLTPLEAAKFGTPTAALRAGGFLDTIIEGDTGVFVDAVDTDAIHHAIDTMLETEWDADRLRAHAARFTEAEFAQRLQKALQPLTERAGPATPLRPSVTEP